jgi:HD superfamily phosphodiesterase
MSTPGTRLIAGIAVPDSPLITDALEYAGRLSDPYLLNHAIRSWLFAAKIAQLKAIDCDQEVVAIGTILHDIGLTAGVTGTNRFEVNGADAALSFIKDRGLSDRRAATRSSSPRRTRQVRSDRRTRRGQRPSTTPN